MIDDQLEVGDVVELLDGSRPMTVGSVADGQALCSWSVDGRHHRYRYPVSALKVVSEFSGPDGGGSAGSV